MSKHKKRIIQKASFGSILGIASAAGGFILEFGLAEDQSVHPDLKKYREKLSKYHQEQVEIMNKLFLMKK